MRRRDAGRGQIPSELKRGLDTGNFVLYTEPNTGEEAAGRIMYFKKGPEDLLVEVTVMAVNTPEGWTRVYGPRSQDYVTVPISGLTRVTFQEYLDLTGQEYPREFRRRNPRLSSRIAKFTKEEAREVGEAIGIDWNDVDFDDTDLAAGMDVELEHGTKVDERVNITDDDLEMTAQIAWAHLMEDPDYYIMLDKMEGEFDDVRTPELRTEGSVRTAAAEATITFTIPTHIYYNADQKFVDYVSDVLADTFDPEYVQFGTGSHTWHDSKFVASISGMPELEDPEEAKEILADVEYAVKAAMTEVLGNSLQPSQIQTTTEWEEVEEENFSVVGSYHKGTQLSHYDFEDLDFHWNKDFWANEAVLNFPNGWGVRVRERDPNRRGQWYGRNSFEFTALKNGKPNYSNPVATDILQDLSPDEVSELMLQLQGLEVDSPKSSNQVPMFASSTQRSGDYFEDDPSNYYDFNDLQFGSKSALGHERAWLQFPNGWGISVLKVPGGYEAAAMDSGVSKDPAIGPNPRGYKDARGVSEFMAEIQELPHL